MSAEDDSVPPGPGSVLAAPVDAPPPRGVTIEKDPPLSEYRAPRRPFTYDVRVRYLHELRKYGRPAWAAEALGVTSRAVAKAKAEDPDFAEACECALAAFYDAVYVAAAQRRAVDGIERPIIGGRNRDEIVAYEKVYSDSLLALLLKAHVPEFRAVDSPKVSTGNNYNFAGGGVLVVGSPQAEPAEWEAENSELANPSGKAPPVPPPIQELRAPPLLEGGVLPPDHGKQD